MIPLSDKQKTFAVFPFNCQSKFEVNFFNSIKLFYIAHKLQIYLRGLNNLYT